MGDIDRKLDEELRELLPEKNSGSGYSFPGKARGSMILNNLPLYPEYALEYYTELGKNMHSLLMGVRAQRQNPNKNNPAEIGRASSELESLIREAIAVTAEKTKKR